MIIQELVFPSEDTLHPTFTPPLLNKQQVYNNKNIINSRAVLINEQQPYDNSILSQNFSQNGGKPLSEENTINNIPYFSKNIEQNQPINFQQQNNISPQEQIFEQPAKIKQEEHKRWDETALSFGPKKTRRLSFKNLKIDDNDIINNREKNPSIDTIKNPMNQERKSEAKTTMVNIPNFNSTMFQEGNFESQTNSLNQPPFPFPIKIL